MSGLDIPWLQLRRHVRLGPFVNNTTVNMMVVVIRWLIERLRVQLLRLRVRTAKGVLGISPKWVLLALHVLPVRLRCLRQSATRRSG